ncbi:MAG TPA: response regulator [Chthonomonadaceae bacterium]|nr:response regulator [Chthonomonadaceae bacterium]
MARILVVDDENNIRMMVRLALQHEGHTVETAADGEEGLDKFGDGKEWDLVLLDQRMPGLSGLTVLQQMRYHDPAARVIMITAFGTVDLAVEAMKAGATDFLRKPFTVDILRGAVQAALTGASQPSASPEASPMTFGMATINGFHIVSQSGASIQMGEDTGFRFTIQNPEGQTQECTVILPAYVAELIKAHTDREQMPGGLRFWQALCEEALANYLYQNAEFPPGGLLRVEDFTSGMRRWVDAVLAA